jgi:hypothetical protein
MQQAVSMSAGDPATGPVHLVVVWRVDPRVQGEVVQAVTEVLSDITSKLAGFREAVLLTSANGTEVLMDIEWDSVEAAEQVEGVPEIGRLARSLRGVAHQDRNTYRLAVRIER